MRKWDVLSGATKVAWDVLSGVAKIAWDVLSGEAKMAWDVLSGATKVAWDVLSGVTNLSGMFSPGWQKNGMGCFVPGCFVLHSFFSLTLKASRKQNASENVVC